VACVGSTARSRSVVAVDNAAMVRPERSQASAARIPAPPALLRMATRDPPGSGCHDQAPSPAGSHDQHRALCVLHECLAGGAELHAAETTSAAASHHEELRCRGPFEQGVLRPVADEFAAHLDDGVLLLPAGQTLGEQQLFTVLDRFPFREEPGRAVPVVMGVVAPRVHRDQRHLAL
jgi:hypothetical protein